EEALDTLNEVLPRASTIHVFSWWPTHERLPLAERSALWERAFAILAAEGSDRDALLEFVPGDDPAVLRREADTLRTLITAGVAPGDADPTAAAAPGRPGGRRPDARRAPDRGRAGRRRRPGQRLPRAQRPLTHPRAGRRREGARLRRQGRLSRQGPSAGRGPFA